MTSDRHTISVVVPTAGRDSLVRCRLALARQTRRPDEVVIVVDHERRGAAWARNEGVRRACGDVIAFIDDGCVAPPDWLEALVHALDACDAAGAGGGFTDTAPLLREIHDRRPRPEEARLDPGGLVGNTGNVMYRRRWLELCARRDGHVFNESFPASGEDWELAWRLRRYGARLAYVPIHVIHLRRASLWTHCRHQFARGCGIAVLARAQRAAAAPIAAQPSPLSGEPGCQRPARRVRALCRKAFGPFCVRAFSRPRHFWTFWLGERFQGAGYVWTEACLALRDLGRTRRPALKGLSGRGRPAC